MSCNMPRVIAVLIAALRYIANIRINTKAINNTTNIPMLKSPIYNAKQFHMK